MSDDTFIGPMTNGLINSFVDELRKKKNRDKIMKNIIQPILDDINERYYPHMMTLTILLSSIIILLILLLIANARNSDTITTKINKLQ
jgi:hypothetical protein